MADQSISQLGTATTLTGDELTVVVQNGVTKQTQLQDIANLGGPAGPVGPQGPTGPTGPGATIQINSTVTGAPGTDASVTNIGSLTTAVFDFVIPRGNTGETGPTGATGATGAGVAPGGTAGQVLAKLTNADYVTQWIDVAGVGTVTSIDASGGTTGLSFTGGPITTAGTLLLDGTLNVANGGSGTTSLTGYLKGNGTSAFTAVSTIPTSDLSGTISNAQLANSSITINGSSVSLGGSTTVTATATNALTIGTGLTGTSYNGSTAVTIAIGNTGVSAATYGSASSVPVVAVNAQGQITSATNTAISIASSAITDKGLANGVASLDGSGTVPTSQLPAAVLGALKYQGTWNASTNTPTLTSSVGTQGYYYVVDVAGSTNLNGITDWLVGDWAIFNGSVWEKVDNTDAVTSVNGLTGTVVITLSGLGAGTIATQNSNNVAITGGAIDGTPIGSTTQSTVKATTITLTGAGSPTDGAGQVYLNGSTSNRIDWNTNGTGAPSYTTRSAGAKLVLYPNLSGSAADYAMGIDSGTLWSGVPQYDAGQFFKWYGGTTLVASLDGTGAFTAASFAGAGTGLTGTASALSIGGNAATATNASNVVVTTGSATTNYLAFVTASSGNNPILVNTGLTYNSSTNAITGGIAGGTF